MAKTSYILMRWWYCFVLDQHAELDFYSASIETTVFLLQLFNTACLAEKQQIVLETTIFCTRGEHTNTPPILCERQEEIIEVGLAFVLFPSICHAITRYQVF